MASSADNPNLLKEFEDSYKDIMSTLTQEDTIYDKSPETLQHEMDTKMQKFTDLARQMETFFSQKRFLFYAHKPELILKEESSELKHEIARKDELIRRHYDKLSQWQNLLQDVHHGGAGNLPMNDSPGRPVQGKPEGPLPPGAIGPMHPGAPIPPGVGAPQGGFIPGTNYRGGNMPGPALAGSGSMMQGPLAYLEKTASSIGSSPYGSR